MERDQQSLQAAVLLSTFAFQLSIWKLNEISLKQSGFIRLFKQGLIYAVALLTIVFCAALPVHAYENLSDPALPGITRFKKNYDSENWARGRILLMPRAGLPAKTLADIVRTHNGKARKIGQSDIYIVNLPQYSEEGAVVHLKNHPHIKFAELDHAVVPALIPNDPVYVNEWHLSKIGASTAWDIAQGASITIAILDSGIDSSHPDLSANILTGWNFYNNNADTTDVTSHGTSVAGVAAAMTNNNIGVAGVAGQSKIMPLRIADSNGYGYYSMIAEGLIYAADRGVRVANVSYLNVQSSSSVQNAAQYMKNKGGLVVVSAGNTYNYENFATTNTMISVSATDKNDVKTNFSSYGNFVALSAPGDGIYTTHWGGNYWSVSGTSFSSPIVAGAIAQMMSANSRLSSTEIENLLFSTAIDLGAVGRDSYYGYGRVNAAAAVQAAQSAMPVQDSEAPSVAIIDPLGGATVSGLVPVDIDVSDNVSVTRAELWVNNTSVAVDSSLPFAFTWDSSGVQNGATSLVVRAYDASGNTASSNIEVNVDNSVQPPEVDTQAPAIQIINPVAGNVSGNITISVNASDNNGASGILLEIYVDGVLKTSGTGGALSTSWNTRTKGVKVGTHTIQALARDAAGNTSTASVMVKVVK